MTRGGRGDAVEILCKFYKWLELRPNEAFGAGRLTEIGFDKLLRIRCHQGVRRRRSPESIGKRSCPGESYPGRRCRTPGRPPDPDARHLLKQSGKDFGSSPIFVPALRSEVSPLGPRRSRSTREPRKRKTGRTRWRLSNTLVSRRLFSYRLWPVPACDQRTSGAGHPQKQASVLRLAGPQPGLGVARGNGNLYPKPIGAAGTTGGLSPDRTPRSRHPTSAPCAPLLQWAAWERTRKSPCFDGHRSRLERTGDTSPAIPPGDTLARLPTYFRTATV